MSNPSTFGERIKRLRLEHNLTQTELGILVGVTKQTLSNIENGKTKFTSQEILERFAFALCCTHDYLLGLSDEPTKLSNGLIQPISFEPQRKEKAALSSLIIKDSELVNLFIRCNNELNSKQIKLLKKIIEALLSEKDNSNE